MTLYNNEQIAVPDCKVYQVIYTTNIKTATSIIDLNVKESNGIRFVEIVEFAKDRQILVPIFVQNFDEFVMALQNMLHYSTMKTKSSRKAKKSRPNKRVFLKTEMTTVEKLYYAFQLVLDDKERVLYLISRRDQHMVNIKLPVSELEEFITKCEIILKRFGGISKKEDESLTKYTINDEGSSYQNESRTYSNNHENRTSTIEEKISESKKELEVLYNPVPRQITYEEKSFVLEIVKGKNYFLRITERNHNKITDGIHISTGWLESFAMVLDDILKEIEDIDKKFVIIHE